jgi:hypothetical protein
MYNPYGNRSKQLKTMNTENNKLAVHKEYGQGYIWRNATKDERESGLTCKMTYAEFKKMKATHPNWKGKRD